MLKEEETQIINTFWQLPAILINEYSCEATDFKELHCWMEGPIDFGPGIFGLNK